MPPIFFRSLRSCFFIIFIPFLLCRVCAQRNITRDFSDGVLAAEVCHHFVPRLVDLHNYVAANSAPQKQGNWMTLQRKVFRKLELVVPDNVVAGVINCKVGVVEVVLNNLRLKIQQYLARALEPEEPEPELEPPRRFGVRPLLKNKRAPVPAAGHASGPRAAHSNAAKPSGRSQATNINRAPKGNTMLPAKSLVPVPSHTNTSQVCKTATLACFSYYE